MRRNLFCPICILFAPLYVISQTHTNVSVENDVYVNYNAYSSGSQGDGRGNLILFGDGSNGGGWQSSIKWSGRDGFNSSTSSGTRLNAEIGIDNVGSYGRADLVFKTKGSYDSAIPTEKMRILQNGNLGIGTTTPDAKLTVKGDIHAEEVKVDLNVPAPDYVFKEGYDLKSLQEVQDYIKEHGHLPNIPSAQEMEENGIELGGMNMKLLEKIEELTLYVLQQEEELDKKDKKIMGLEEKHLEQEKRLKKIEKLLNTR
ncbi:hypothetical protein FGF1_14840 [Flavobacteriaceae bacterium GF1]